MRTHNIPFAVNKMTIALNYLNPQLSDVSKGLKRVRNSHGKRAISVRATEGQLYVWILSLTC